MSPDDGTGSGERLGYVVDEVAAPGRLRCVTRDRIPYVRRHLPALYFRDWSLQGEPVPRPGGEEGWYRSVTPCIINL